MGLILKSVSIGSITTLDGLNSGLDNVLNSMNDGCAKLVSFTVGASITGFDTTAYAGILYKFYSSRAWLICNTAFNFWTVASKNTTWAWKKIDLINM